MKKAIFGIFAHPDDEAFGPAGTLLNEVKQGTELHLITLTAGEGGQNPDNLPDLKTARLEEWRSAGKLLGATSMHYLGFADGQLSNIDMLGATENIKQIIRDTLLERADIIEIVALDLNGISGHIDHIVATRASLQVFYQLKQEGLPMSQVRLACLPIDLTGDQPNLDFVFMEPGRLPEEIDEISDNRQYLDDIYAIMKTHHSQRYDSQAHISQRGDGVAIDYFVIKK